jgi:hypothetical protein
MSTSKKLVYWIGGVLGVGGIAAVPMLLAFDVSAFVAAVAGNVGLVGLIGVLFQLLRDEAAHQKEVLLQHDDQLFQVGATSHMANTVFDKHVRFSEEYVAEVQRTVDTLFKQGPHEKALEHASNLQEVRREHATWVTQAMSNKLMEFEQEVRIIGAKAHFVEVTTGNAAQAVQRSAAIDDLETRMEKLLPEFFNKTFVEGGNSPTQTVERVRGMLGVNELVELRTKLIVRAHKAIPG